MPSKPDQFPDIETQWGAIDFRNSDDELSIGFDYTNDNDNNCFYQVNIYVQTADSNLPDIGEIRVIVQDFIDLAVIDYVDGGDVQSALADHLRNKGYIVDSSALEAERTMNEALGDEEA